MLTFFTVWSLLELQILFYEASCCRFFKHWICQYSCFNSQLIFGLAPGLLQISSVWRKYLKHSFESTTNPFERINQGILEYKYCMFPAGSTVQRRHNSKPCNLCQLCCFSDISWRLRAASQPLETISSWTRIYVVCCNQLSIISFGEEFTSHRLV